MVCWWEQTNHTKPQPLLRALGVECDLQCIVHVRCGFWVKHKLMFGPYIRFRRGPDLLLCIYLARKVRLEWNYECPVILSLDVETSGVFLIFHIDSPESFIEKTHLGSVWWDWGDLHYIFQRGGERVGGINGYDGIADSAIGSKGWICGITRALEGTVAD